MEELSAPNKLLTLDQAQINYDVAFEAALGHNAAVLEATQMLERAEHSRDVSLVNGCLRALLQAEAAQAAAHTKVTRCSTILQHLVSHDSPRQQTTSPALPEVPPLTFSSTAAGQAVNDVMSDQSVSETVEAAIEELPAEPARSTLEDAVWYSSGR